MIDITLTLVTFILGLGLLCSFVRLIIGPHLIDRIAATDAIILLTVGFILLIAIKFREPAAIQSALAVAVFSFLGNLVFAKVISPRSVGEKEEDADDQPRI
jgi:multicomponent K+:H+ antiporter subunit F